MVSARLVFTFLLMSGAAVAQQYAISTVAGGAPVPTPIAATSASIGAPSAIASGPPGAVYFAGDGRSIYKIDAGGGLSRVAGNGRGGFSGDGGPATSAPLSSATSIAVDAAGNVYIADFENYRVRKVAANGIITTVAGNGIRASGGDGGPATTAQLTPSCVAVDAAGNLYIADGGRVRKVATNGIITTIAGNLTGGTSGDGGPATSAQVFPSGIAVDAAGTLYIAESFRNRIRKVATNGIITTVAGNGSQGFSEDGRQATSVPLYSPSRVTVDATGTLYILDSGTQRILKVTSDGIITTAVAKSFFPGFSGDGGPASNAHLYEPSDVAVDAAGIVSIADQGNYRIRQVTANGIINTVAGNGSPGYSGDGGPATSAQLSISQGVVARTHSPPGISLDGVGNLYIADNQRIRKVATDGVITTVAGIGSSGFSGDGGPATSARLSSPSGLALDAAGNLYIFDRENLRIRKVTTNGIITTVAGIGNPGCSGSCNSGNGDGGPATSAQLSNLSGSIAVDAVGNLYLAEGVRVRRVGTNGIITTVAGNGTFGYSGDGGLATSAQVSSSGVAVDGAGNLYIAESQDFRIRRVTPSGIITTVAGIGRQEYTGDDGDGGDGGPATSARLYDDRAGIAVDTAGNLYIAGNNNIRKVATNGIITTVAGTTAAVGGPAGYSGDGGSATNAQLSGSWGVTVDAIGNVYVADSGNNAIRLLKPTARPLTVSASANAASNLTGPVARGEIVVLYGSGIGPSQLAVAGVDSQGRYGTNAGGTRVFFNGIPAPMIYTSLTQASAIVPYNLSGTLAGIQIEYQGTKTDPIAVSLAPSAPALFTVDSTGTGQAAAFNEDGSLNSAGKPVKVGGIIVLYATGEGQTSPAGVDGKPATAALPKPLLAVQVTIDGKPAEVIYAGGAPGLVAGLMQINARIPAGAQVGNVPVVITVGSASSPSGVTIAVAGN